MPHRLTLSQMTELIRARKLSPVELMDAHLKQIEKQNPRVNAFVRIVAEQARTGSRSKCGERLLVSSCYSQSQLSVWGLGNSFPNSPAASR